MTIAVLLGLAIGCAYTPWMASYTEQVEAHNPALAAHGLAVWGWILRIVVALSFIVLPRVITTSTVLVDNQAAATNLQTFQAAQPYVPAAGNIHPPAAPAGVITSLNAMEPYGPGQALAALLKGYATSHDIMAGMAAVPAALKLQVQGLLAFSPLASDIQAGRRVSNAQIAGVQASSPQLATLLRVEPKLVPAQKASPGEWKRWWWVCAVGQLVFLVLVFFMRGRWSPRAAKADFDQHERLVATELEKLRTGEPLEPLLWPDLAPTGTDDSSLWVHASNASPVVIEGATIIDAFGANVRRIPGWPAMRRRTGHEWEVLTWADYGEAVAEVTAGLADLGIGPGERVAVLSGNRVEWHVADIGALANGNVTVPVYPTSSAEQVGYILGHSGARLCFVENHELLAKVLEVRDGTPKLDHVVVFDDGDRLDDPFLLGFAELRALGSARLRREPGLAEERAAASSPTIPPRSSTPAGPRVLPRRRC